MKKKIIVYWKLEDRYVVYSSLVGFAEHNPQYNISTMTHWITRKGVPYQTSDVMVLRCNYIARAKK
jgi:hypothetical protein